MLSKIFGGMGGKIIDSLDGLFTSDEERLKASNELEKILNEAKAGVRDAYKAMDAERTKRHENDMKSDSWLSKNVRPMSLVFLLAVVSGLSVTDGNFGEFSVGEHYIDLYGSLLSSVFMFYFGGRSFEKIAKVVAPAVKKKKEEKPEWDDDFD